MTPKEINAGLPESNKRSTETGRLTTPFPLNICSSGFLKAEEIHPVQFESYFYSLLLKSKSDYYNPINFRHNLDPTFWQDLLDSYYGF